MTLLVRNEGGFANLSGLQSNFTGYYFQVFRYQNTFGGLIILELKCIKE